MDQGLLAVPAGPDVVRFLPPLNVSREEMTKALDILHYTVNHL
jgi:acetylornithine aminotransferase